MAEPIKAPGGGRFVIGTKRSLDRLVRESKVSAYREITSGALLDGMLASGVIQHPDALIRERGLGIYDDMTVDEVVNLGLQIWNLSILEDDIELQPHPDGGLMAEEQFAFVKDALARIGKTPKKMVERMLTALIYGYSLGEKVEETITDGRWALKQTVKEIVWKPPHHFRADVNDRRRLIGWRQEVPGIKESIPLPAWKFIHFAYGERFDSDFYGRSLLRPAYKYFWMKELTLRFWMVHLDRYSSPLVIGYMHDGASDVDKKRLEEMLDNIAHGTSYRLPKDLVNIDVVEFQAAENYDRVIGVMDKSISKALLIFDLMGATPAEGGTYSLGKEQFALFYRMKTAVQEQIIDALNQQLVDYIVDLNYYENKAPRLSFLYDNDDALDAYLDRYKKAFALGAISPQDLGDVNTVRDRAGLKPISPAQFEAWVARRGSVADTPKEAFGAHAGAPRPDRFGDAEQMDVVRGLVEAVLREQGVLAEGATVETIVPGPEERKTAAKSAPTVSRELFVDEMDHERAEAAFAADVAGAIRTSGLQDAIIESVAEGLDKGDLSLLLEVGANLKGRDVVRKVMKRSLLKVAELGRLAAEDELEQVRREVEEKTTK